MWLVPGRAREYLLAILIGTLVSTGALFILKRPIPAEEEAEVGATKPAAARAAA